MLSDFSACEVDDCGRPLRRRRLGLGAALVPESLALVELWLGSAAAGRVSPTCGRTLALEASLFGSCCGLLVEVRLEEVRLGARSSPVVLASLVLRPGWFEPEASCGPRSAGSDIEYVPSPGAPRTYGRAACHLATPKADISWWQMIVGQNIRRASKTYDHRGTSKMAVVAASLRNLRPLAPT